MCGSFLGSGMLVLFVLGLCGVIAFGFYSERIKLWKRTLVFSFSAWVLLSVYVWALLNGLDFIRSICN